MDANIVIVGAGVVGLAIARELSLYYDNIYVIEKHKTFGQETSSRNSEVIHSGIYYPKGSLKAKLCVEGKKLLYEYCQQKQIPHKKIGKLVVATNAIEQNQLNQVYHRSIENGVTDARIVSPDEIKTIEPNIKAAEAIYYPTTGIVDSFMLMKQLEADSISQSVSFIYNCELTAIKKIENGYLLTVCNQNEIISFSAKIVINSAGLFADNIAKMVGINDSTYTIHFWKGEYFSVHNGKNKYLKHLIYPVPNANQVGLGIHATLDMQNSLKLGPNAIYLPNKNIDYTVNPAHATLFYNQVKSFLPFIELDDLSPSQAGIRPKLQKPDDPVRDFIIKNEEERGLKNFINLIGIESPGLTSCLAIGKFVKKNIDGRFK